MANAAELTLYIPVETVRLEDFLSHRQEWLPGRIPDGRSPFPLGQPPRGLWAYELPEGGVKTCRLRGWGYLQLSVLKLTVPVDELHHATADGLLTHVNEIAWQMDSSLLRDRELEVLPVQQSWAF